MKTPDGPCPLVDLHGHLRHRYSAYIPRHHTSWRGTRHAATTKKRRPRRGFGRIERLPSGKHRAGYIGPDLALHRASTTFDTREDAEAWITAERRLISEERWTPPAHRNTVALRPLTLAEYAERWISRGGSRGTLKPRTEALYRSLLDRLVLPDLGNVPLGDINSDTVRTWYARLDPSKPTQRAHAYDLLATICNSAVADDLILASPCRIRGGGKNTRRREVRPATLGELAALVEAMPEQHRALVILAAWCALRFGEVTALRRSDIDFTNGVIRVRRAVVQVGGHYVEGDPKSDAGRRTVAIPPHLLPIVREHRDTHSQTGRDGLLFPAPQP